MGRCRPGRVTLVCWCRSGWSGAYGPPPLVLRWSSSSWNGGVGCDEGQGWLGARRGVSPSRVFPDQRQGVRLAEAGESTTSAPSAIR
jgi:hypothetical protein